MNYVIKGGELVNSRGGVSGKLDIMIKDGKIAEIGENIQVAMDEKDVEIIDATGLHILPGLIDIHVHFREPGGEAKETFETGSAAALAGGFTRVVMMPNTKPAPDTVANLKLINDKINSGSKVDVYVAGAITKSIMGEEIAEIEGMCENGIVGITDDGRACMNMEILEEAYNMAKKADIPVICHCEDHDNTAGKRYGDLKNEYEYSIIDRDVKMGEKTGAHVHITHLSVKEGLDIIEAARKRGVNVTCDVTSHHLTLNYDENADMTNPLFKVNPPIRSKADMEAMIQGVLDGKINCIASDHAPHEMSTKTGDIDKCAFGLSGIEVSFPMCYTQLCVKNSLPLEKLVDMMTIDAAEIVGMEGGIIKEGERGDITLIDLSEKYSIDPEKFISKGKNSPLKGKEVYGKVKMTFIKGNKAYEA